MQIPTEFQPHLALSNDLGYDTRTGHFFVDLYAYSNVTSTVVRPVPPILFVTLLSIDGEESLLVWC